MDNFSIENSSLKVNLAIETLMEEIRPVKKMNFE